MDEETRNRPEGSFRWQEWLLEGFRGLTETVGTEPPPPEFWQHLGKALCELGTALQLLGVPVSPPSGEHLLEAYERLMDRQGYRSTSEAVTEPGESDDV